MASSGFRFELMHTDTGSNARRGRLHTPRGSVELPTFMPVGTLGTVKGVDVDRLRSTGSQIVLGNTYHLALRPGADVVASLGGLHEFMGWSGPILTDSGGFQVFSLADRVKVTESGVSFRSHIDGSPLEITPERSIAIQELLGSDFAMAFDHVVALPNKREVIADATWRSVRWAERCRQAAQRNDQMLLGIVQGGLDPRLRQDCAKALVALDFQGYAIGGLSVGEPPPEMYATLEATIPALPADRPRYLMGVGRPEDLVESMARGVDMFDCVMPTRNGRNALAFTDRGTIRLRNAQHERDSSPLEADCPCPACQHSRGYLRHLFQAKEMLGPILTSIHNITYYQRLMAEARLAIESDAFDEFRRAKLAGWEA
ncbi:tRNA guanosine(34) transglycosylase Tgt [Bythopirellula polymerisocia]|uniref:Queuine tRNA-ribosyltransferase n=1 Tax=Bythopirellula polymerisocia TaxID=2528003 RepID=A0A5C6CGN1_9BACT|nr:tRNA guanosine(34) transglycosylase Tgt [Bythopirellula polymerisocia]TWU23810.1 Queuine tRNA-ribosyltransferase [Bythopirellula polymerisocia]